MKKIILGILCFFLIGCTNTEKQTDTANNNNSSKTKYEEYFDVIGIYKSDSVVTDKSGVKRDWIHVVFDIKNTTDENWKDDFFWSSDQHILTLGKNTYESSQNNTDYFSEEYGFTPLDTDEIWAGGKYRFYLNFIVNNKDIENLSSGNLMIKYGDMEYNKEFTNKDIETFNEDTILQLAEKK